MLTTQQLRNILFTVVIVVLLTIIHSFELPFLQTCTIEDEKCQAEQVTKFFEMYGNGIPELNISTFDPMYLGDIQIKGDSNENTKLEVTMGNSVLHKYPKVKCIGLKGFTKDMDKPTDIVVKLFWPELISNSHCRIKGKILLFNVEGETDMEIITKNFSSTTKTKCRPYTKDGKRYYKVDQLKPHLDISSLSVIFSNSTLFNGEQIFMESFADTINKNWEIFRDEMEPHFRRAFERINLDALNKVLGTIPLDKFFKASE